MCARGLRPERQLLHPVLRLDGSSTRALLLIPLGRLPAAPTTRASSAPSTAIERELLHDGFVLRYRTEHGDDGLPPGEGAFLPCTFWLADAYAAAGPHATRRDALFERLLGLRNDVGLLAEEYDPAAQRQLGNFPQAFTHLAFVRAAANLARARPAG